MVISMKDSGWIMLPTVMDDSCLLMATCTLEVGKWVRRMEKVTIIMRLVLTTRATGMKINNMDLAGRSGPTTAHMKVTSRTASKKALAISIGPMAHDTKENGRTTKCMARVFLNGMTAESTKATTSPTKNMASGSTTGQTDGRKYEGNFSESEGKQHVCMEKVFILM